MGEEKKAAVIGAGNLLLRDEGFGVHLIRHMEQLCRLPRGVELVDGGTAGMYMAPVIESCGALLVVDTVALEAPPGSVHRFSLEEFRGRSLATSMSPHQVGILEIMEICKLRGMAPDRCDFLCVVPQDISSGVELTPLLASRLDHVSELVLEWLKGIGVGDA